MKTELNLGVIFEAVILSVIWSITFTEFFAKFIITVHTYFYDQCVGLYKQHVVMVCIVFYCLNEIVNS